jgi:hypothetical protein
VVAAAGERLFIGYVGDSVPTYSELGATAPRTLVDTKSFHTTAGALNVAVDYSNGVAFLAWTDLRGGPGDGSDINLAAERGEGWSVRQVAGGHDSEYPQLLDLEAVSARATVIYAAVSAMARSET